MNPLTNKEIQELFLDYSRTWEVLVGCKRTLRLVLNPSEIERLHKSQRLELQSLNPLDDAISSINSALDALSDANEKIASQLKCDLPIEYRDALIAENIIFTDIWGARSFSTHF